MPVSKLFCFGLGYTALRLADRLAAQGWSVAGTCRGGEILGALAERGIETHHFDRDHPLPDAALDGATHVLSSVPPDGTGDAVVDLAGARIAAMRDLKWAGYLSTTAVYGDRGGAWVDETADPAPTGERGARRLAAERCWLDLWREHGVPVHVFRLAGIYGPGRSALDRVRDGAAQRVIKPGHVLSRIHVDDIVGVLDASMRRPNPGAVYNVCDDAPAAQADIVAHACALLGVSPPPEVPIDEADLTPAGRSFYADNRRVRNDRIKRELGVTLKYPTYREGLAVLLADEGL